MPSSHVQFTPTVNLAHRPTGHEPVYIEMPNGDVGIICPTCKARVPFNTTRNARLGYFRPTVKRDVEVERIAGTTDLIYHDIERIRMIPSTWTTAVCLPCWRQWRQFDAEGRPGFLHVDEATHKLKPRRVSPREELAEEIAELRRQIAALTEAA